MKDVKVSSTNSLALKSGTGYIVSSILISSTSLITAPIFTRLLSTTDYGIASNFTSWLNFAMVIISLGLPYSIGNAKVDFPNDLNKYLSSIQILGTIMSLSVLSFVIIFKEQFSNFMLIDEKFVLFIFIYLIFYPSVVYAQERYKFNLQYKQNIFISIINTFGSVLFCLFLIKFPYNSERYTGRILGMILPMFLMGLFFYFKIFIKVKVEEFKKYWNFALKIGIPMIPHSLGMIILSQLDRIMITRLCGNSDAGLYSFGFSYAILLALFSNAVLQAFQPWLYTKYKSNDLLDIKKSINLITVAMCAITFIIIAVAPEAIKILGSKLFWNAKWVVFPIAIGSLFQYVYNTYIGLELYHKKNYFIALGTILAALINYFLNILLIPLFGFIAAAYATAISYCLLAFFHLFICRIVTKKKIFNDRFIWGVVLFTSIISFLIVKLYDLILIRYLILCILLSIILFLYKNSLKFFYNSIFYNP